MSFKSFARAPAASGQGCGARSAANPSFSFIYVPNHRNVKELETYSYSFRGRPAINTISSSRTTIKKKEPPKDDSPNRRRRSAPISASLFRYYSASPNASVIRIDLLDLTIADTGITLDLNKDWHPDLYENRNAGATWFIFFKHINNPLSVDDLLAGFQSTSPVLFLRLGTKKAPQLGLKCLFLSMD